MLPGLAREGFEGREHAEDLEVVLSGELVEGSEEGRPGCGRRRTSEPFEESDGDGGESDAEGDGLGFRRKEVSGERVEVLFVVPREEVEGGEVRDVSFGREEVGGEGGEGGGNSAGFDADGGRVELDGGGGRVDEGRKRVEELDCRDILLGSLPSCFESSCIDHDG